MPRYIRLFIILSAIFLGVNITANAQDQLPLENKQIPIWPNGKIPHTLSNIKPETVTTITQPLIAGKPITEVWNVSQPTMTVYSPTTNNTGAAVIVFPGGGFHALAIDLEGTEICQWLTSQGITAILLKYRVPNSGPNWNEDCKCYVHPKFPTALEDAQRTLGIVRYHAVQWHIDPNKIGVIGFSAGGFMVADISTHFKKRAYTPLDAADKESCRPDFAIALYPGHMRMEGKPFVLNPSIHFTKETPPTFLLQAEDDPQDNPDNSLLYYIGLKKAGVPVEMHLYAHGGHGFGLRHTASPITEWPQLVKTWLNTIGVIHNA